MARNLLKSPIPQCNDEGNGKVIENPHPDPDQHYPLPTVFGGHALTRS